MNVDLAKLLTAYRAELELYREIRSLVVNEGHSLRGGEPLTGVIDSLRKRQQLLAAVRELDRDIAYEKREFQFSRQRYQPQEVAAVGRVLAEIRIVVEDILAEEAKNEAVIVAAASQGEVTPCRSVETSETARV